MQDNSPVSGTNPLYNPVPIYGNSSAFGGPSKAPICLEYKIGEDSELGTAADSGIVYTSSDVDYTVKVEAQGLKPFTTYYYQFNVCDSDKKSPVGRTKTAPGVQDSVDQVNLAVYSCSNFRKTLSNLLSVCLQFQRSAFSTRMEMLRRKTP